MGGGFGAFLAHSNIVNFIKDVDFPCSKQDLINHAEDHNAPQKIIEALEKLPDKEYTSIADVTENMVKSKV